MKINKTIPKDKSNYTYYSSSGLDLKCTKPLLLILKEGYPKFTIGVYVHSRKEWLDELTYTIDSDNIIGWVDMDNEI
jgi:hypothetical protein